MTRPKNHCVTSKKKTYLDKFLMDDCPDGRMSGWTFVRMDVCPKGQLSSSRCRTELRIICWAVGCNVVRGQWHSIKK